MKIKMDLYVKQLSGTSVVVSYNKSFKHCTEFCSNGQLEQYIIAVENMDEVILTPVYVN